MRLLFQLLEWSKLERSAKPEKQKLKLKDGLKIKKFFSKKTFRQNELAIKYGKPKYELQELTKFQAQRSNKKIKNNIPITPIPKKTKSQAINLAFKKN